MAPWNPTSGDQAAFITGSALHDNSYSWQLEVMIRTDSFHRQNLLNHQYLRTTAGNDLALGVRTDQDNGKYGCSLTSGLPAENLGRQSSIVY